MRPLIIGHRGASAYALENTSSSFQLAANLGVDMVELDVHESFDGEFVVIHDRDLRRISGRKEVVRETHSKILRSIELYNGEKLLLLGEVFEFLPDRIGILVELKCIRHSQKMADFIAAHSSDRAVLLASFDLALIRSLQDCNSALPLGIIAHNLTNITKARSMKISFGHVCLDFQAVNARSVEELKRHNQKIYAWTLDRPEDIRSMVSLGVDGIISNRPDEVSKVLERTC